jgi:hypothetical protein
MGGQVSSLKIDSRELAEFERLVAALPMKDRRDRPGQPGGSDQPLSAAELLERRSASLGIHHD